MTQGFVNAQNIALPLAVNQGGTGVTTTGDYVTAIGASQSDQETGTSTTKVVTPGVQKYHPSAAKAWVMFNGQGTVAITAGYNVSSVTDIGTGNYSPNYTVNFSSANYSTVSSLQNDTVSNMYLQVQSTAADKCTVLSCITATNAAADPGYVRLAMFGDQ